MSVEFNRVIENDIIIGCECGESIKLSNLIKQEEEAIFNYFCAANVREFKALIDSLDFLTKEAIIAYQFMMERLNKNIK